MSDRSITIYCGLLLTLAAFSIDITLPFFAVIRDAFGASNEATHAIITLNIFSLGIGQLVFGSFSDRFGRRAAIVSGLSLYLLGTLVALLAGSIDQLLVGRVLQGLGAAAGPVTARAIIRDRFSGQALAQNMAVASGIFSIGPILAPLIGAGLVAVGGDWRLVFAAMATLAGGLMLALLRLPETLRERRLDALSPRVFVANIGRVLRTRQSRYFLLLSGWIMTAMVIIVAGMARVMEFEFGITGALFAILFAVHGLGVVIGQIANHWLIGRIGAVASASRAALLMTASTALLAVTAALGWLNGFGMAAGVFVFAIGYLMVYANAASMTLEPHGEIAGFTAAFYGFFGQATSSILASLAILLFQGSALGFALALLLICSLTTVALLGWMHSAPPATPMPTGVDIASQPLR